MAVHAYTRCCTAEASDRVSAFERGAPDPTVVALLEPSSPWQVLRRSLELGQYLSAAYRAVLTEQQVQASAGRPETAYDNAVVESFLATRKTEVLYRHLWRTRQAAKTAIFEFIESWYNRQRLHSTLRFRSPLQGEEDYTALARAA
jgi:transposase InsO family protein